MSSTSSPSTSSAPSSTSQTTSIASPTPSGTNVASTASTLGQSSTAASSAASPSNSSSIDETSLRNSSSLLFGFLVTFLALFVIFMVFGLGWRHWMDRRRRRRLDALEEIREKRLKESIPKIWDVWVAPGTPEWKGIMPLSAGAVQPPPQDGDEAERGGNESENRPSRVDSALGRAFSRFGGSISIPYPLPPDVELTKQTSKKKDEDNIAKINDNGLEIAVVITMPTPAEQGVGRPSTSTSSSALDNHPPTAENAEIKEYALGVTQVHLNRPINGL